MKNDFKNYEKIVCDRKYFYEIMEKSWTKK
jgi:hypothetical protein